MVPIIDVVLILAIAGFVFYGFFFGFIRTLGALVSVFVGAILASRFYLVAYDWIGWIFGGYANLGKVLTFIIVFSVLSKLVGLVFYLLDKFFNIFSIIPFLKIFNKIGGGILGFLTGSLFVGMIIYVVSRYSFIESLFGRLLVVSKIAPILEKFTNILLPLLPEFLKSLQSLI